MATATFVTLTPEELASHEQKVDRWTQTLIQQANDDTDPETQANAQTLLTTRGIAW